MIYQPDSNTYQYQCTYGVHTEDAFFPKDDGGQDYTEDWHQEVMYGNAGYRIVLQQQAPQSIGNGRNQCQIKEQKQSFPVT